MRVGTRTELKRKWTPQGHRPKAPVKIGYEFIHLFVAIAPFSGKIFAMFLPRLDQDCFALFSKEFDESLTQKTMLIADRATAHKAALMADTKIELQKLPTACPELNPVERFFKEMRRQMACKVFNTLQQAEDTVVKVLQTYFQQPERVMSITKFPYLNNTS
jgi:transposase